MDHRDPQSMSTPSTHAARRMQTVRTVAALRAALEPARRGGATVGLVPTMGALHEGHLSLIRAARERCDVVVVSLFVNPAQFDERADLDRYPRREREDAELAAAAGADLLFAPAPEEVYPEGFSTFVEVVGLTDRLEGTARGSEHFRGVTTVVTKLLNMVGPDVAFFGQKDAQQLAVIRRLVSDLDLPVRIEAMPIVREADGLAMSSRNVLLDDDARLRARALPAALAAARERAAEGQSAASALGAAAREELRRRGVEPDYVELVDPATFEPRERLDDAALLVLAARIDGVRLIDNELLPADQGTRVSEKKAIECSA
jgi:pantoate--beta-alanine ligase